MQHKMGFSCSISHIFVANEYRLLVFKECEQFISLLSIKTVYIFAEMLNRYFSTIFDESNLTLKLVQVKFETDNEVKFVH